MDRQEFLRLRKLKKEIDDLRKRIRELKPEPKEFVTDTVQDYSTGYPHTIAIEGYGSEEYKKEKERLYNRLVRKMIAAQQEAGKIEEHIEKVEDPELRTILRLMYINGLTQEQIADELGYSRSAIAMKLKRMKNIAK